MFNLADLPLYAMLFSAIASLFIGFLTGYLVRDFRADRAVAKLEAEIREMVREVRG